MNFTNLPYLLCMILEIQGQLKQFWIFLIRSFCIILGTKKYEATVALQFHPSNLKMNWEIILDPMEVSLISLLTCIKCDNYVPQWWVELDHELSWLFTHKLSATRQMNVKRMGITERIWLFSSNKIKKLLIYT